MGFLGVLALILSFGTLLPSERATSRSGCRKPKAPRDLPSPLPSLAGVWDLQLIHSKGKPELLTLELRATDSAQRTSISPIDGKPHHNPTYLYYGTLSGSTDSAQRLRKAEGSWDPDRPGVKVYFGLGGERTFHVSIGAEKNDRTRIMFDGWDFWLEPLEVSGTSMAGTWTEGVWVVSQVDSGTWCASRRP